MRIPLDRESPTPLYQQVHLHISQAILDQKLAPDTRLPASRELAERLGISRITVENAYAELEADGLVVRRMGSGTYVLSLPASHQATQGATAMPRWQEALVTSPFTEKLRLPMDAIETPLESRVISFADGGGDSRLYPVTDFRHSMLTVLRDDPHAALRYGDSRGLLELRQTIAQILTSQGLTASMDNVLITGGSQQALALTLQVLLSPGDTVAVESATYARALELMKAQRLRIVGIPTDDDGMDIDALAAVLRKERVGLIYTIPNFNNPTGSTLSSLRRRQLVALAESAGVPIFEDDYVGDLRYDGLAQPALKSLDTVGNIIYTGTFSKMLLPGIRVGFMLAEGPVYDALVGCKLCHDLATSNLMQHALHQYVSVGRYQKHLRRCCKVYRQRRDAMCDALERECSDQLSFSRPAGGLFVWAELAKKRPAGELARQALSLGISITPGESFTVDPSPGERYLRLNFACNDIPAIQEGVSRLTRALRKL